MTSMRARRRAGSALGLATLAAATALASCGGGKKASPPVFPPSSDYAARCALPRSGTDPLTGLAYPDRQGTVGDEKTWVRSWIDELYLWYREVPNATAAAYPTVEDYFAVLQTRAVTASGKAKDQFHFSLPTAAWEALSTSGIQPGYGVLWIILAGAPPRQVVAAYNEPGSPAAAAGIGRGAQVLAVDGVDLVNGLDVPTLEEGLFPSGAEASHTFSILDPGAGSPRSVTMTSAEVPGVPVQNVGTIATGTGSVGYLLFNDHLASAEAELMDAFAQLASAGVDDLVLDMRYNGGGYLFVASELAYMIAGPGPTAGKAFERLLFNERYPADLDPVTGLSPSTPFFSAALGFSATPGTALPFLGLSRVFVLTGRDTCSASEAVINGLRGIDLEVIQVGSTTCGKPYGFYPQDNCGITFFAIEFQGVNAKGFGDYADGLVPGGAGPAGVPGCQVADDFTHALGDPAEARLAAALGYRASQTCPPPTLLGARGEAPLSAADGVGIKSPWHQNRILPR
jgi:hypothetical protein